MFFEGNTQAATVALRYNRIAADVIYGVALHPVLADSFGGQHVDAQVNWWGAADGPKVLDQAPTGSGAGATDDFTVSYHCTVADCATVSE